MLAPAKAGRRQREVEHRAVLQVLEITNATIRPSETISRATISVEPLLVALHERVDEQEQGARERDEAASRPGRFGSASPRHVWRDEHRDPRRWGLDERSIPAEGRGDHPPSTGPTATRAGDAPNTPKAVPRSLP